MARVTILIPSYNKAPYLPRCLGSVLAQTRRDWVAVVADNASEDGSADVVAQYVDERIRLVRRGRTLSPTANFNLLLEEITTEYAVLLTADDWWEPTFLEVMVELLDQHPESLMAAAATRVIEDDREVEVLGLHQLWPAVRGSSCPPARTLQFLLAKRNRLYLPAVLVRRRLFEELRFDDSLVADWLLLVRAAELAPIQVCPQPLFNYRRHHQSLTATADRAGLWGLDLVRAARTLRAEWTERGSTFGDASRVLARTFTLKLLVEAYRHGRAGRREVALFYSRLAASLAPGLATRLLSGACEGTLNVLTAPGIRPLGRRLLGSITFLETRSSGRW